MSKICNIDKTLATSENICTRMKGGLNLVIPDLPPEYILDSDAYDSFYISQRYILVALEKLLKGEDVYLTLYNNQETKQLLSIYKRIRGDIIDKLNIIWVPLYYYRPIEYITGNNFDWSLFRESRGIELLAKKEEVSYKIRRLLIENLKANRDITISSYSATNDLVRLMGFIKEQSLKLKSSLEVELVNNSDIILVSKLRGKGFLHPNLDGEMLLDIPENIRQFIPKGIYIESEKGYNGLIRGFKKLIDEKGINKFVIKPVLASSGEGIKILEIKDIEVFSRNYNFSQGDIIIEEALDIQEIDFFGDGIKSELSVSVQYLNGKLMGNPSIQITKDSEYQGNFINCNLSFGLSRLQIDYINRISNELIDFLGLYPPTQIGPPKLLTESFIMFLVGNANLQECKFSL